MTEAWKNWEGQVADGRFRLRQYLGASERGPVFLTDYGEPEPRPAAIKLVPAEPQNADAQLARWTLAATLAHPQLLRVLQMGRCQVDGARLLYVVSELADEDLSQIIPQRALRPAEAHDMLRPVLEALAYLQSKGLVHGHIKPSNIVAVGDQLKISSDGICAARDTSAAHSKLNAYDAPEAGTRGCSAAGDVWSLGVTLVEVLTQQLPAWEWKGQEEPELPKVLPAPFGDIVRQCLRRDPQRRCTLAEIATRLDPDAPALGKLNLVEQPAEQPVKTHTEPRVTAPPAARAPKPPKAVKPAVEVQPGAADNEFSPVPKRSYAIPAMVIGIAALVVIFAAPKLFNRSGAQASRGLAASAPEKSAPKAKAKKADAKPPAEKLFAKRTDTSEAAPPTAAPPTAALQPTPVAKKSAGDVVHGSVAHQVLPEVPQSARSTISGTVRVGVRVNVNASGKVADVELDAAGPSKYFADLAVKAAREWEFTPAKLDGQATPSEWILRFEFAQDGTKVTPIAR
jgi:TonB family protein